VVLERDVFDIIAHIHGALLLWELHSRAAISRGTQESRIGYAGYAG